MSIETRQEWNAPLLAIDRCDKCRAQAYVRITLPDDEHELLFCAHHGRQHLPVLRTISGMKVYSEIGKLEELEKSVH